MVWSPLSQPILQITIIGDLIVYISTTGVTTWAIPPMTMALPPTLSHFDDLVSQPPTGVRVIPFRRRVSTEGCTSFLLPSAWYHKTEIPFIFDALYKPQPGVSGEQIAKAFRYVLSLDPADQTRIVVTPRLTLLPVDDVDAMGIYSVEFTGSLELGHLGATVLRTCWWTGKRLRRHIDEHKCYGGSRIFVITRRYGV